MPRVNYCGGIVLNFWTKISSQKLFFNKTPVFLLRSKSTGDIDFMLNVFIYAKNKICDGSSRLNIRLRKEMKNRTGTLTDPNIDQELKRS